MPLVQDVVEFSNTEFHVVSELTSWIVKPEGGGLLSFGTRIPMIKSPDWGPGSAMNVNTGGFTEVGELTPVSGQPVVKQ